MNSQENSCRCLVTISWEALQAVWPFIVGLSVQFKCVLDISFKNNIVYLGAQVEWCTLWVPK